MRLTLATAAFAALVQATPASAQEDPRNFVIMGGMTEARQSLLMMVSDPLPNTDRPYRAIVAWSGAPDRYWYMAFAFDCASRTMSRRSSGAKDWRQHTDVSGNPPANGDYDHAFESFAARAICDRDRSSGGFATFDGAIRGAYQMTTGKTL